MHLPKEPTEEIYAILRTYQIDPFVGKVFNASGVEIGQVHDERVRIQAGPRYLRRSHIIWWRFYNEWPTQLVDHEDRNSLNDRISNLRNLTSRDNSLNKDRSINRNLPSNVYPSPEHNNKHPYMAKMQIAGQPIHLGMFAYIEDAADAVQEARILLDIHGPEYFQKHSVQKVLPKGVHNHSRNKKNPYKAKGWKNGKEVHLGYFPTPEEAHQAYLNFEAGK